MLDSLQAGHCVRTKPDDIIKFGFRDKKWCIFQKNITFGIRLEAE